MKENNLTSEEKEIKGKNGILMLLFTIFLILVFIASIIFGGLQLEAGKTVIGVIFLVMGIIGVSLIPILFCGLKVINPNEALVLTLFGNYYGILKKEGFFWVNPFCTSVNPAVRSSSLKAETENTMDSIGYSKKLSLKTMTLNNEKQKVNDSEGNPIIIGVVVIWKITNTAKAVFNVNNYKTFLSIQCDSTIRNIARLYPYDISDDGDEKSLRGSSQEVAQKMQAELQERVDMAGLEILDVKITHLSYAPEIAAAMLQRQQASAIIAARQKIVEGAVGMVEMALETLNENNVVNLDEERKAAMVSNLLVVLCGNKDAQPIVNSGSIY